MSPKSHIPRALCPLHGSSCVRACRCTGTPLSVGELHQRLHNTVGATQAVVIVISERLFVPCAPGVQPSTRGTAQRTPHWHLFSLVTVAVLSPTNSYVLLLYPVPELHSTCPSTYATGSTEPGDSHDTCASHPSHLSQVDEKKAKNCAQKHMGVPGCAVR